MKLIHLSDLHLGKRVNEFSMIEDQQYILAHIINIIDEEKPQGIIIAGDVYDKSIPSEEAVGLLNDFLVKLAKRDLQVYIISGNHDSAVKLAFASELIDMSGIHIAPAYSGEVCKYVLEDADAKANIYMLPFVKPANVKKAFPDEESDISDYTDALKVAISHMEVNDNTQDDMVNILVAHQFVTGATRSDSEEISVGGVDNVEAEVFNDFDYVALGHIHGPQKVYRDTIRYCGTPLKYSFSEVNHKKSVTVIDIKGKNIDISTRELTPKHDMRIIKGKFDELMLKENYVDTPVDDYLQVVLTDEEDVVDAIGKLRIVYPNIMKLAYDNTRTRENRSLSDMGEVEEKSPLQLFEDFYENQNNQPMSDEQNDYINELIEKIWEV